MIFPKKYIFLVEVTRFEESMPLYSDALKKIGRYLRNKVVSCQNESDLAMIMNVLNLFLDIEVDILGQQPDFIHFYVQYLIKKIPIDNYQKIELSELTANSICENTIKNQWEHLRNIEDEGQYERDFIQIMDDLLKNAINEYPKEFYVDLNSYVLTRGRRGSYKKSEEIMPPSIETAIKYGCLNRWNPPNKRYNYLVVSKNDMDIETSLLETRTKCGEYTVARFEFVREIKKILNLDFEKITFLDIEGELLAYKYRFADDCVKKLRNERINDKRIKKKIKRLCEKQHKNTLSVITIYTAKMLLKYICKEIFVPLSEAEDNDKNLKEQSYKPFHIFAEYLENNGIEGIRYPSTRQKLNKGYGSNVVLFDADCVYPIADTITVINADDYIKSDR